MSTTTTGQPRAAADKFRPSPYESRLRMQTIIRLRWFGVGGQLVTVLGVYWGLGFDLPVGYCLALIAASAWVNVFLRIRFPARFRLSTSFAAGLLAYDIVELAALLYLTGGLQNPFAFLIVAPVTVSAATLPARYTVMLGLLAIAASAALVPFHWALPWAAGEVFQLPLMYKLGILASIAAGMIFLALYVARLSKEARQMSTALVAIEHVLAREQRLHALDGLAAAAAHELGTPLATITLVTKELERDADSVPGIKEDIRLLRTQADRCREILRKLTRSPSDQDPHHMSLPLTQLLQEAAAPYQMLTTKIEISSAPVESAPRTGILAPVGVGQIRRLGPVAGEPVGERRPGVIYGIGNLIENAADFASAKVEVRATWTDREVVVTVSDDGPGFSPDIIGTLGDPYVTTRSSGQRPGRSGKQAGGLGLGFFIAKTLLERSGARLSFKNRPQPDHGAVVRVSWPRDKFDLPASERRQIPVRREAAE